MLDCKSWYTQQGPHLLIRVTVRPLSTKNEVKGLWNNMLKVSLQAAPEKGKANEALIAFFAIALGKSRSTISIQSGPTAQNKTVLIENYTIDQFTQVVKF